HASAAYMAKQILQTQGIYIPVVTTLHGTDITLVGKDPSYEPVVTFSINQSDGVTAVSQDLVRETYASFKVTQEIKVIPNFIDLEKFKKQKKDHFKRAICPHGEPLIVHTSNFREVKRVMDVVQIFNNIAKEIPAKLLMIGDGPDRDKAEDACRHLQISEHVRFLGKLEAIEEVLSVADPFIMPSAKESFGLAAIAAMACEGPVIASNVGGLPELNVNGEPGFLSAVGDDEDMTRNALCVLEPANLRRFRAAAPRRAEDFDVSRILPLY